MAMTYVQQRGRGRPFSRPKRPACVVGEEDGVCCRRQRRRRLFGRPDHEACVAGEEAFVIVEGHYNIRAEMWYAWEVMSSRKAVMWRPWK
jgi:hypothetical protein